MDFDLFHQSAEAENCYGPFAKYDLSDAEKADFGWAGPRPPDLGGLSGHEPHRPDPDRGNIKDMVMRLDVYVGERDTFGVGFSDNVIFRRQVYVRAVLGDPIRLELHDEGHLHYADDASDAGVEMDQTTSGWKFDVADPAFDASFGIELFSVPESGDPIRFPGTTP